MNEMNEMLLAQMLAAGAGRLHGHNQAPMLTQDQCCALGALLITTGAAVLPEGQGAWAQDQAGFTMLVDAGYDANFLAGVNDGYEGWEVSMTCFASWNVTTESLAYQYGQELGAAYRDAVEE